MGKPRSATSAERRCTAWEWGLNYLQQCTNPAVEGGNLCTAHVGCPPAVDRTPPQRPRSGAAEPDYILLTLSREARRRLAAALAEEAAIRPAGVPDAIWKRLEEGREENLPLRMYNRICSNYPRVRRVLMVPSDTRDVYTEDTFREWGSLLHDALTSIGGMV